jgi:hypothetical protein
VDRLKIKYPFSTNREETILRSTAHFFFVMERTKRSLVDSPDYYRALIRKVVSQFETPIWGAICIARALLEEDLTPLLRQILPHWQAIDRSQQN